MFIQKLVVVFTTLLMSTVSTKRDTYKGPCANFTMVTREEWRGRPPTLITPLRKPINRVVIAHTATNLTNCKNPVACVRTVQAMQSYGMDDNGFPDIPYNFMIGGDGRVYEGTGWSQPGSHSMYFNAISVCVGFIGNYMKVAPSENMLQAAQSLIACGVEKGFLTPTREINGHRDIDCTLSPGDKLYSIIKKWKYFTGGKLEPFQCSSGNG